MTTPGWRTQLLVHGVDLPRLAEFGPRVVSNVPVVSGLLETVGGLQIAMSVGDDGQPVILTLQAASQHIVNMREVLLEHVRLAGERPG